ncbi:MAG: methyltransferase domain-containing protein [Candidatus Schekmanbacteria bacterium]|nr:methyltransferase domain-containing protein [Candidatus Schekmanbacteria bacterium]
MTLPDFEQLRRLGWEFRENKIFLAVNDLDLFTYLSPQPLTAQEIAQRLNLNARALEIVLDALVSMKLLDKKDNHYSNQEIAEAYLVNGKKTYRGEIFKHLHQCREQWENLGQILRTGELPSERKFTIREERRANRHFIWGMDNIACDRAQLIAGMLDLSTVGNMLDLGGGAATYSIAFVKKNPQLKAVVLDLPLTLEVARENIALNDLEKRISTTEGSFWEVGLGTGYDLVWISQIIHSLNESKCRELIQKAAAALAPGGALIIHDFILEDDHTRPFDAALFSVHMLVVTEGGRSYSVNEIMGWLKEAGLSQVQRIEIDAHSGMVRGTVPVAQAGST